MMSSEGDQFITEYLSYKGVLGQKEESIRCILGSEGSIC